MADYWGAFPDTGSPFEWAIGIPLKRWIMITLEGGLYSRLP
jgi:hypothetical protein